MDDIKITSDLEFDFFDLMKDVDIEQVFTLRDITTICKNSKIPLEILQEIIQCRYLNDYFEEIDKPCAVEDGDCEMIYLEVYWVGDSSAYEGKKEQFHQWSFHGMGAEGDVPEDLLDSLSEEEMQKLKDDSFKQAYAIEFTPVNKMADIPIRVCGEMNIVDWEKDWDECNTKLDFRPSITLVELLYSIFWEISFLGSPERRDEKSADLARVCEDFEDSKDFKSFKEINDSKEDK